MASDSTIIVVNVMSVSFSGSTWVNLMLGSHPEACSIGEIKKILEYGKMTCTLHGDECPVFSKVPYPDWPNGPNPYARIAEVTGKRFIIVNNSRKFLHYGDGSDGTNIENRFIHLVRDGRAVTASMLRKWDTTMFASARLWAHDVRRNRRLINRQNPDHRTVVNYEAIKADPAAQLARICEFLGVEPDPGMTDFWNTEHHFFGGNRGTLHGMLKKADPSAELAPNAAAGNAKTYVGNWDLKHYEKQDPANFKDERWKSELTDAQLRMFNLVAGRLNRRYGYAAGKECVSP